MKSILLIGLGRFGSHIAMKLSELGHQVMAVDMDEERANSVLPFATNVQIGDSTNGEFMESLGVESFDACIVAIGDEFENSLVTTSLLKELGAKKVIARASRGVQEKILLRCGADEVVYPEKELAAWTAIRCTSDHILDYIELDGEYSIFELAIPSEWDGKTVVGLDLRRRYGINILAVRDDGVLKMNITPDMVLESKDTLYVLGTQKSIQKCFKI